MLTSDRAINGAGKKYVSYPSKFTGWTLKEVSAADNNSYEYSKGRLNHDEEKVMNRDRGIRTFNLINNHTNSIIPVKHKKLAAQDDIIRKNRKKVLEVVPIAEIKAKNKQ